ncbi:MAG: hypothetical protein LWW92_08445 [Rhodocyclales bacterium]|nr:hypothetical protein [Rhodocyclales bacterium]
MPVDNAGNTNTSARSIGLLGSTAQSFNDYVGSYRIPDEYSCWAVGARGYECIWDEGGTYTIDVGKQTQGCTINLNPGTRSSVGSGQFLYASGTGQLWFDQDGTGSGQAVLLATLSNRPTLGASDIQLVSA